MSVRTSLRVMLVVTVSGGVLAAASAAQPLSSDVDGSRRSADGGGAVEEIVVTAQRQSQSLQDVPIAVSAFSAEALERQQIENMSDLQLSLPNVTFTSNNFTNSNLSVRGIGRSVQSTSADSGVGIHINDMPVVTPLLFETEFFDMERIELLRGPQGTLFGRNATGGVMNLITARPTDEFGASVSGEYGNFDAIKANGMINVPLGEWGGFRLAGQYLKRDGYTKNLFGDSRLDGRDSYAVRGTLRVKPTDTATLDLVGYFYREASDRSRIQKQLCARDETAILGCRPDRLGFDPVNGNATLFGTSTSREFLSIVAPPLAPFALGSVYGPDFYSGAVVPTDTRTVVADYKPQYRAHEFVAMAKLEQEIGDSLTLNVIGGYQESANSGRGDYSLTVANSVGGNAGIAAFRAAFPRAAARLFQGENIGVSAVDRGFTGYIGGNVDRFAPHFTEYDQSNGASEQWSIEAHLDSRLAGPFNFLLGANYLWHENDSDFFVAGSELDYASLVLGTGRSLATATPQGLAASAPFYDNENRYRLKALGLFGEAYYELNDQLRLTLGARYTQDDKTVRQRQAPLLLGPLIPFGTESIDVPFSKVDVEFGRLTGRAVIDWKPETTWSDDTLVYASYSRGYKGGGVNPAVPAIFNIPQTFAPETVNAFEIGTKNRFVGGVFQANLTAFYYDYQGLQVSRVVNRTSVNDNTDAAVYGIEGEFLIAPTPALLFNINASYLNTRIKDLQVVNPRDPSGGRSDVVIIKDITSASNCAVIPTAGAPRADALVNAVNARLGLRPVTPVPGTATVGAFSICSALAAAGGGAYTVSDGVEVDISGNELQNSPNYKFSVGGQHSWDFANDMSLVARVDYAFTGDAYGSYFNGNIDRIDSYGVVNAQVQLNGPGER